MCFRRDCFIYLFKNSGTCVSHKPGKSFVRSDFCDEFFCDSDFVFVNECGEGVRVVFPIYMYSHVKCVKLCKDKNNYTEVVYVKLCKERFFS